MNVKSTFMLLFLVGIIQLSFGQNLKKYCNQRFNFCTEYPSNFSGLGESQNGDGQNFISKDKLTKITIFGNLEIEDINDLKSTYKSYLTSKNVTYKLIKDNYFVISGFESKNKIFYIKVIKKKVDYYGSLTDVLQTVYISYPKTQNDIYSAYCKNIAKNFN
ncbi:hypothetical protein [Empedobacter falsenii]|uniref:Uncharacterized protein n=1 Tax=Empedobacter falsenii TaxID=343874 RepID=A0AAW7DI29_9FLAO|nr:hypothetical protein [Empedobacter falsenii]MDM1551636.1 hypothetical protein [Empedobacter falsenii]